MVELVPSRLTHVGPLASRIREADRIEVEAMGRSPKEALRWGLRVSLHCFTALIDGRPEAMMGLVPTNLMDSRGLPWMLGTPAIYENGRALLRFGRPVLSLMLESCATLENFVGSDNEKAIRFLKWLGFTVADTPEEHGSVSFLPFKIERASC